VDPRAQFVAMSVGSYSVSEPWFDRSVDPSMGHQRSSLRPSSAQYSVPKGRRPPLDAKLCRDSPGPGVYDYASALSRATAVIGTGPQIEYLKAYPYPDMGREDDPDQAHADAQDYKFPLSARPIFGYEERGEVKNCETLRHNPEMTFGRDGPGPVYDPDDRLSRPHSAPSFTMRQRTRPESARGRTPPEVSPSTYQPRGAERALGRQLDSRRKTARSSSFSRSDRFGVVKAAAGGVSEECAPMRSSFGSQCNARARSAPRIGFGSSTRDSSARSLNSRGTGAPAGRMGPPRLPHPALAPQKELVRFGSSVPIMQ